MIGRRKPKKVRVPRVPRTCNGGTETHAQHMGKIRSALRNISRWWKPMKMVLDAASRTYMIGRMRRVEYLCSICKQFHPKKNVEVNHIVPAGSLRSYADIPEFCARLFSEDPANYEVLCKDCHLEVTKEQRKKI